MNAHMLNKPVCRDCWARYHCGGGCHAIADCAHGNILEPDPIDCELTRCRLELGLMVYAQLAEHAPDRLEEFYSEGRSQVPSVQREALRGL